MARFRTAADIREPGETVSWRVTSPHREEPRAWNWGADLYRRPMRLTQTTQLIDGTGRALNTGIRVDEQPCIDAQTTEETRRCSRIRTAEPQKTAPQRKNGSYDCALPERLNGQASCERFSIAHVFVKRGIATKRHPLDTTEETETLMDEYPIYAFPLCVSCARGRWRRRIARRLSRRDGSPFRLGRI